MFVAICGTLAVNDEAIELLFLSDEQIRPYYREYFGEDRPTDVIAFPMDDDGVSHEVPLLGCIVISVDTAKRQAKEHRHSLWNEIRLLIIHGFLHLLGYDHAKVAEKKVMQKKEKELLALTTNI